MGWGTIGFVLWVVFATALVILAFVFFDRNEKKKFQQMTPQQREAEIARKNEERGAEESRRWSLAAQRQLHRQQTQYGPQNPVLVCPHCETQGEVRTKAVTVKSGISGGKATGAILTGGLSMLATGLSRKEGQTQAHCDHCSSTWHF